MNYEITSKTMGILLVKNYAMEINRGANRKCYEAVSFTSASSSCSHFSNCYKGEKKALFLEVQKKPEAGNFWTRTRETLQWPCKVTRGVGRAGEG